MTAAAVALPTIERLSYRDVERIYSDGVLDGLTDAIAHRAFTALDAIALGAYRLPRGAVFVKNDRVKRPFAFAMGGLNKETGDPLGRSYVVVARELGDLTWPAFLWHQRSQVSGDVSLLIQTRLKTVMDWAVPGWATLHRRRLV